MNAGLLTRANADDGTMVGVRNAVRLGVLQRECSDNEVSLCLRR